FVQVSIGSKNCEAIDGGVGERVLEPPAQDADAVVQEAVPGKVRLDVLFGDRELCDRPGDVTGIGGVVAGPWLWNSLEGVREPDDAVGIPVRRECSAHEDRRTPAPHAGLDEVAGNVVPK